MTHRRSDPLDIAVTGMGLVTPGGDTLQSFWKTLCSGVSTAAPLSFAADRDLPVRFGCEVRGFDPESAFGGKDARRMDRVCQLAVTAGLDAIRDSGFSDTPGVRGGVIVGTGIGGMTTHENALVSELNQGKVRRRNPLAIPMLMANASAAQLAIRTGWTGANLTIATACASGANAIGEGARLIRDRSADIVLAGGAEAPLTVFGVIGFHHLRALSTHNDDPPGASRPFDESRDGFVLAEGAAFVVLESSSHARARGAKPWAYVCGYGCNNDASDLVMPKGDGTGMEECLRLALEDADVSPREVLFVNAHGTSTVLNDRIEAQAIRRVFGAHSPPVTSVKGVIGHSLGASGAVELIATCLSLATRRVPPTANYRRSEPQIDIDVVCGEAMVCKGSGGVAVSNSFGFGGSNACLAVSSGERCLEDHAGG